MRSSDTEALSGIKVLDLCRVVSGPFATMQLGDLGADVVKIEDPRKGDPLRDWRVKDVSVNWKVYARNKKSVTLNLRDPQGLALLRRLAATAHVFIENFRPGTLEQMGIGPDRGPESAAGRVGPVFFWIGSSAIRAFGGCLGSKRR